jgi:putative FmdB family regulatory protein
VPIYEYLCEGCAYKFEVKQSIKDDPLAICERCGKKVIRLISTPAIMFKGSGWYVTDYSEKLKPPSGSETPAPAAGEKKDSPAPAAATSAPSAAAPPSTPTAAPTSAPTTSPVPSSTTPPASK